MPDLAIFDEAPIGALVGREPTWIVRSGMSLIFSLMLVLLLLAWFIRYPDVIVNPVVLTSSQPPVEIISKVDGPIANLYVANNSNVKRGQTLLIIESYLEYRELKALESKLNELEFILDNEEVISEFQSEYWFDNMGALQASLNQLIFDLKELNILTKGRQLSYRIASTQILKNQYLELQQKLVLKKQTLEKKYQFEKVFLEKKVSLVAKGAVSKSELAPVENRILDNELAIKDINIQNELYEVKIKEIEQTLDIFQVQYNEKKQQARSKVRQSYVALRVKIAEWKQQYLIVSPIDGKVSFSDIWSKNQHVKQGQVIITISDEKTDVLGKLKISQFGSGRIHVGQHVDIELDSYPAVEFGKVQGEIREISHVPGELGYLVDVKLSNNLITSYGKNLPYTPNLTGSARIITAEKRLLERFLDKILYIFKKNQ